MQKNILSDPSEYYNLFGWHPFQKKKEPLAYVQLDQKPMGLLAGASQRDKEVSDKEAADFTAKHDATLKKNGIVGSGKVKQFIADQGGVEGATAKLASIGKNVKDFISLFRGDSSVHLTNPGGDDITDAGFGESPSQKADREAAEAKKLADEKSIRNAWLLGGGVAVLVLTGIIMLVVRKHRKGK